MRKVFASAVLAGAIAIGSLFGAGSANAIGDPGVCDGIDEAPSYQSYLIDAYVWGVAFNYSPTQQAYNIVSAVETYCPWHLQGIKVAAASLSN